MKLTRNGWPRAAACAIFCLAAAMAMGQAPSTTTVTGTVYLANGQPGAGTLVLSWPTFTTAAGQLIAADSTTVTIPADGFVSVNLVPNQGSTPAGEYYTAVYYMSDGSTHTQYWVVPAAASATLAAVQSQVMPAAQAVQAVSKAYVDDAIAALQSGSITSSGGSLTGPLYLNGDPTVPLQAADKHYVDTEFGQALPLNGGTLTGPVTVRNSADAEVDYFLWPGLTASQSGSFTYKDWNGNSQWSMVKDASNNWALNSTVGGLDSFKAYQSTNSGDTYMNASNAAGHIRLNYESGSGVETDIYAGSSSSLVAAFLGTASIRFPGLAASSGTNCLQIDNAGNISNTGAACGAGGSGGSGTVNPGATNQVAVYSAPGAAVSGSNSLSLSGTMSGAGMQDTLRPVVDTFTVTTASLCGNGTDELAKLCQIFALQEGTNLTGTIARSTGVSGTTVTGSTNIFPSYYTAIPFSGTPASMIARLAPGTQYTLPGELDIPTGAEVDGQTTYAYYGTPRTGTWLEAASTFPFAPTSSLAGNVVVNMGSSSSSGSATFGAYNRLHDVGIDAMGLPWSTCVEQGQSQQGSFVYGVNARNCTYGLNVDNFGNGAGGAQNHGPIHDNGWNLGQPSSTSGVIAIVVTAGGSYTQAPNVTVSGCSVNPNAVSSLSGSAVSVATIVNTSGNGYGSGCSPGSVSVSFDTTYGSGATAVAVISSSPPPIGMRLGGVHGSGGGLYWTNSNVGSGYAISRATGVTLDNSGETLLDTYIESSETGLCVGCNTSNTLFGNSVYGLRSQSAQETVQTLLQLGVTNQSNNVGSLAVFGMQGSSLPVWIQDNQVNGGTVRNDLSNPGGITAYLRQGEKVFSLARGIATTGQVLADSFYNCGTCTTANEPRIFLPGKLVNGYVTSMALGDTAQPVGIGANGSMDTNNLHKSAFAYAGLQPEIMDPGTTVTAGDYVCVSTNTVVSGQSIAGGVDCGSTFPPTAAAGAWTLGRIPVSSSSVALSIPGTPSVGSATITPSPSGSVSYAYEVTVVAGDASRTESAPSSAISTSTGPASLVTRNHNTIAGLTSASYNVYRTTLGSSSLPTLTAVMAGGQLAYVSGWTGLTGYTWVPSATFSGGSCTIEPVIQLYVSAGGAAGYYIKNVGSGCSGTPTISLAKSTCETGWIGQFTGTSFTDYGFCGDGTTPPASGLLAPLMKVDIRYAGVPGTGNVNGPGSSTSNDVAAFNGTDGAHIKDTGVQYGALGLNTVPAWLQYLGTGADGAESVTSGSTALSGEKFYTTFNVSAGAIVTANGALIIHATGACTVNGSILANGPVNGGSGAGFAGAASGGSGGGTAAGTVGQSGYASTALSGNTISAAGGAGAASGGNGGNGVGPTTGPQRAMTNGGGGTDGMGFAGAAGKAGGSSGGAAGSGGQSVILICGSITGTGVIDVSGGAGGAVAANSTGGGSGGGGGVAILSSQATETYSINIDTGGGAGGQASVPYAVPQGSSSVASGNQGTIPPILTLGVSGGALSSCTVTQAGSGLGSSPAINFTIFGGGGSGGTITPTYSGGAVVSCTASGGSGYTATTYTTAGNGGYGGAGWSAEFSGW